MFIQENLVDVTGKDMEDFHKEKDVVIGKDNVVEVFVIQKIENVFGKEKLEKFYVNQHVHGNKDQKMLDKKDVVHSKEFVTEKDVKIQEDHVNGLDLF